MKILKEVLRLGSDSILQVWRRNKASAFDLTQTMFSPPWSLVFLVSSRASFSSLPTQTNLQMMFSIFLANCEGSGRTWDKYHSLLVPKIWRTSTLCWKVSRDLKFQEYNFPLNFCKSSVQLDSRIWAYDGKISIPKIFKLLTLSQGSGHTCLSWNPPRPRIFDLVDLLTFA